jgi:hypothetical protein
MGSGGEKPQISNCLPADDLPFTSHILAGQSAQSTKLQHGRQHRTEWLFEGRPSTLIVSDRQSTLLELSHGQGYEPMTTGDQFPELCRKLLLPSAWSVQPKDTSHARKMYMLQG